ncbi:hypothetical protein [Thiomicrorhabdus indica]|uniref:hypothetical protein n=1 Tax=Thiomicrorhabdus indica TaxID=2267253 RepID=UPI00102D71CD|nr:hypothetical protein [Thiomicrorhabdus indica]
MTREELTKYIEQNRKEMDQLILDNRYEFIKQDFEELGESDILRLYMEGNGDYAVPERLTSEQVVVELLDAIDAFKQGQIELPKLADLSE